MMMTAVMTMLWRLHSGCWREREALRRGGGRWDGGWRRWRRRRWGAAAPAHHWSPPPAVGRWGPTWELATTFLLHLVFPLFFHFNPYCPPTWPPQTNHLSPICPPTDQLTKATTYHLVQAQSHVQDERHLLIRLLCSEIEKCLTGRFKIEIPSKFDLK